MKISVHETDSLQRQYNVDTEDLTHARDLLDRRMVEASRSADAILEEPGSSGIASGEYANP